MALSIKDLIATVLAAFTAYILYIQYNGSDIALLGNTRIVGIILIFVGLIMCVLGSNPQAIKDKVYSNLMGGVGGIAVISSIVAIIVANPIWAEIAAGLIILMWLVTTARHLGSGDAPTAE